jgi:hypothetical protein
MVAILLGVLIILTFSGCTVSKEAEGQVDVEASGGLADNGGEEAVNRLTGEKVLAIAATGSLLLNGEFGDLHEQIVADGHRDSEAYAAFQKALQEIGAATNAAYVYTLIKVNEEMTNLIVDAVQGEDAKDYRAEYAMEPQFELAFSGTAAYAEPSWDEKRYGAQISAFAPVYNSEGVITAVLGVDYPYDDAADPQALAGGKVMYIAALGSLLLNGEYGDLHEQVVSDGNRDSEAYEALQAALQNIRDINGVTYVYTLIRVDDEMTNLIVDAAFGDEADEYAAEYEMEPEFDAAFSGTFTYLNQTWDGGYYSIQKTGLAPIYNSAAAVVAILGVDHYVK